MLRVDLQSTSLKAVTYHDRSARLELEFRSGAIYRYSDVPALVYQELLRAESNGQYFNQHIRNRFIHTKIKPAPVGPTRSSAVDRS